MLDDSTGTQEQQKKHQQQQQQQQQQYKQPFRYYCVIDFEATCDKNNPNWKNEIIEFPVVVIDSHSCCIVDSVQYFVKPIWNPKLTEFCIQFTGITQDQVDQAGHSLQETLVLVHKWLEEKSLFPLEYNHHNDLFLDSNNMDINQMICKLQKLPFCIICDGPWDMSRFLEPECKAKSIPLPIYYKFFCNIRTHFSQFYKVRRTGIDNMLKRFGLKFEGREHSGLDDSKNIARIAIQMMKDGCHFPYNSTLIPSYSFALMKEPLFSFQIDLSRDQSIDFLCVSFFEYATKDHLDVSTEPTKEDAMEAPKTIISIHMRLFDVRQRDFQQNCPLFSVKVDPNHQNLQKSLRSALSEIDTWLIQKGLVPKSKKAKRRYSSYLALCQKQKGTSIISNFLQACKDLCGPSVGTRSTAYFCRLLDITEFYSSFYAVEISQNMVFNVTDSLGNHLESVELYFKNLGILLRKLILDGAILKATTITDDY